MIFESRRRRPFASPILMIGVLLGVSFMGNDIIAISVARLNQVAVRVPAVLQYVWITAPVLGLVVWFGLRRRDPILAAIAAVAVCYLGVAAIDTWADHRIDRVRIKSEVSPQDLAALESRLGFRIGQTSDSTGTELFVDRTLGQASRLTAEVIRMGIPRH